MLYMDSYKKKKNSRPSMTNWLFNWINIRKNQVYPNWIQRGKPHWSRRASKTEHLQGDQNKAEKFCLGYKKASDDMVLQSWITECLKMYKIFDKIINFMTEAMKNRKVELAVGRKNLGFDFSTTICNSNDATITYLRSALGATNLQNH